MVEAHVMKTYFTIFIWPHCSDGIVSREKMFLLLFANKSLLFYGSPNRIFRVYELFMEWFTSETLTVSFHGQVGIWTQVF